MQKIVKGIVGGLAIQATMLTGIYCADALASSGEQLVEVCSSTVVDGELYRDNCDLYSLPACQFEDGNPDGTACVWTDPDTGSTFYVQSHNYGDPACGDICLGALAPLGGVR